MSIPNNIFTGIPDRLPEELIECLFDQENITIERIISKGHITPIGQWYDQDWDEWVILLKGKAVLCYEQDIQFITLMAGNYLLIPAHTRHCIVSTATDTATIWLAIHIRGVQ